MGLTKIELQIGELVLRGFAPEDRHRVAAAVQQELTRLLAAGGLPEGMLEGAAPGPLDAGAVRLAPGATPQQVGGQVARAVYGSLGQPVNSAR